MTETTPTPDILNEYMRSLVDRTYGDAMDDDAKHEAIVDMTNAFQQLYGVRLLEQFTDEQRSEVEALVDSGQAEKIPEYAVKAGVNMPMLMSAVLREFEELYAPQAEG